MAPVLHGREKGERKIFFVVCVPPAPRREKRKEREGGGAVRHRELVRVGGEQMSVTVNAAWPC